MSNKPFLVRVVLLNSLGMELDRSDVLSAPTQEAISVRITKYIAAQHWELMPGDTIKIFDLE